MRILKFKPYGCIWVLAFFCLPSLAQNPISLANNRFQVTATWKDVGDSNPRPAVGGTLDNNTGYFHFLFPGDVDLVVKLLDSCNSNNHYWVFAAGLTDVEVELTVTDTMNGVSRTYTDPSGIKPFNPIGDTMAFATCPQPSAIQTEHTEPSHSKTLGLLNNRFSLDLNWRDAQGDMQTGSARILTNSSGAFTLSSNSNDLNVFAKIIDGGDVNGSFWVYLSGMVTNELSVTVTDTQENVSKTYSSEAGHFLSVIDRQFGKQENHRWVFPWISNNANFGSRLIVNNYSPNTITVQMIAIRADGTNQTVEETIAGGGFLNKTAATLFGAMGEGPGYSVIMTSPEPGLAARWVTNNLGTASSGSPSQGVAIKFGGGNQVENPSNGRLGRALMFGYLPNDGDTLAAPVIVNTGNRNTNIDLFFFDTAGQLVHTSQLSNLIPQRPMAMLLSDLYPGVTQDVSMVAYSDNQPITGVVFTFNNLLEPSLGNAEAIPFVPPGATP